MITIHRPVAEPTALSQVRGKELPLRRASAQHDITGYGVAKDDLFRSQFGKCCYCEKSCIEASYNDVEHFRPKSAYWWLAWTWENLLFACPQCNRSYKRDLFPLAVGSTPLIPEQGPPGSETPLLIDPTSSELDPVNLIEFRMVRIAGKEYWRPFPRDANDPRGKETIRVCGLDREELWEAYRSHVNTNVRRELERFHGVVNSGNDRLVVSTWKRLLRHLLGQTASYSALSFDALRALVAPDLLERFRLQLPAPPV